MDTVNVTTRTATEGSRVTRKTLATYEHSFDLSGNPEPVFAVARTETEMNRAQKRAAAEALSKLETTGILTVWVVKYESKHGRRWVKNESSYLVFEQAQRVAVMTADRGPTYRNVTLGSRSVFTHV